VIRFAWLQSRTQATVAGVAVAVVALITVITGPHLGHLYATTLASCRAHPGCSTTFNPFSNDDYALFGALGALVLVMPAIAGLFWGAPLVARELESGTYRLAWTQSVGRSRWLASKIAVLGLVSLTASGLLSLAVSWSARSIDLTKADRFRYFDQRDIVPLGYAAFAFAVGVVMGLLIRRVLPALGASLAAFVAGRFVEEEWLRSHLAAATHSTVALSDASGLSFTVDPGVGGVVFQAGAPHVQNSYLLSAQVVDRTGHVATGASLHQFILRYCPSIAQGPQGGAGATPAAAASHSPADPSAFNACIGRLSAVYHESVSYIPPVKYWSMQWAETGIFLVVALALVALALWAVRRLPS